MKLLDQYRELHGRGMFKGLSLEKHVGEIGALIKDCRTLLDYGSGKGVVHERKPWNISVTLYDPAVKGIDVLPVGDFDAVICTDVLEHIPEDELDEALNNIFSKANKVVYLSISTKPAKKFLPNGDNAHVTVKSQDWWLERIALHAHKTERYHVKFN